jgi:aspartyl-tRNA(Asn)/glutamyl-tRNA(Gln) amidotransferase subunit C
MTLDLNATHLVAELARLDLTETQLHEMAAQLSRVLDYASQLQEIDTSNVEPLFHPHEKRNRWAEDVARPSMDREQILKNAPKHDGESFHVPAVIGQAS